jgi:hypothetical protein
MSSRGWRSVPDMHVEVKEAIPHLREYNKSNLGCYLF